MLTRSTKTYLNDEIVEFDEKNHTYFPVLRAFKKKADIESSRALPLYMRWVPDSNGNGGFCTPRHFTREKLDRCMKPNNVTVTPTNFNVGIGLRIFPSDPFIKNRDGPAQSNLLLIGDSRTRQIFLTLDSLYNGKYSLTDPKSKSAAANEIYRYHWSPILGRVFEQETGQTNTGWF